MPPGFTVMITFRVFMIDSHSPSNNLRVHYIIDLVELFHGLLAITDQETDKATITSLSKDYGIDL